MSPPTLKHSLPRQWFLDDPQGIAAALVRVLDARLATIYARANGFPNAQAVGDDKIDYGDGVVHASTLS